MKTQIEILWEAPPTVKGYVSKFDSIVNALLENPGQWIRLPYPSKNSNSGLRMIVTRGKLPIKISTRSRPDGLFDIYAVCTTGIDTDALSEVPEKKESNA